MPKQVSEKLYLADDIALEYYRNTKVFEGSIDLEEKGQVDIDPPQHAGSSAPEEEKERLSIILEQFNERYGTEFTHADKIMEEIEEHLSEDKEVQRSGENNTFDNFRYSFDGKFMDYIVENIEKNTDLINLLEKPDALDLMKELVALRVYQSIRTNIHDRL